MDMFLLRHAEAGEAARDEIRELTEHGHAQASSVAAGIAWLTLGLDTILSSPLARAAQTAAHVAKALKLRVELTEALATGQPPEEVLNLLKGRADRTLLVGHEPQLSGIALLTTGGHIRMRKAMLARIELHDTQPVTGDLSWLLTWRQLDRLAAGRRCPVHAR